MRYFILTLFYSAALLGANPAFVASEEIAALKVGEFRKLVVHETPRALPESAFESFEGAPLALSDYRGKWILVNFWATWCAPCRKEMPALAQLQKDRSGADFEVITIATSRSAPAGMVRFFENNGIENLPLHRDPKGRMARSLAVLGLPVTLLISPDGKEVARMQGDADWSGEEAHALLDGIMKNYPVKTK